MEKIIDKEELGWASGMMLVAIIVCLVFAYLLWRWWG